MKISVRAAKHLLGSLIFILLIGTQMPGLWRDGIVRRLNAPSCVSAAAHFILFASIAVVTFVRPLSWHWLKVCCLTFSLALLTEFLQFFAIDRHPRWLDVGIDMSGTLVGMVLTAFMDRTVTLLKLNK